MSRKQGLTIKYGVTTKERIRFLVSGSFLMSCITGLLIFFIHTSGATMIDIITGADAVYYDFRDVFVWLYFPVVGYVDILVFLALFSPLTLHLAQSWYSVINIVYGYIILAFFLAILLSLVIPVYPLSVNYYSCGKKGPFSGAHYVKKKEMCQQFEYHPDSKSDSQSSAIPLGKDLK